MKINWKEITCLKNMTRNVHHVERFFFFLLFQIRHIYPWRFLHNKDLASYDAIQSDVKLNGKRSAEESALFFAVENNSSKIFFSLSYDVIVMILLRLFMQLLSLCEDNPFKKIKSCLAKLNFLIVNTGHKMFLTVVHNPKTNGLTESNRAEVKTMLAVRFDEWNWVFKYSH